MMDSLFGKGFYEVKCKCTNCGTKQSAKITKGKKAEDVIGNGKCENCGCQNLILGD